MNTCEYCGQEVNRKVFCSPSHKSMYYRNKGKLIIKEVKDIPQEFSKPKFTKIKFGPKKVKVELSPVKSKGFCKHGVSLDFGFCKHCK